MIRGLTAAGLVGIAISMLVNANLHVRTSFNPWHVTGGRGYPIIEVTNLDNTGAGSLRAANTTCVTAGGGRIQFAKTLSGDLTLSSDINFTCSNMTLDGSTAANQGVQVRGKSLVMVGTNQIMRYMKVRGQMGATSEDCVAIVGGSDILIEHLSTSSCADGSIDIGFSGTNRRIVVAYSLFAWKDRTQGGNVLIDGDTSDIIWYRNLSMDFTDRGIKVDGNVAGTSIYATVAENVFYDGIYLSRFGNDSATASVYVDLLRNIWKRGPSRAGAPSGNTNEKIPLMVVDDNLGKVFLYGSGNLYMDNPSAGYAWSDAGVGMTAPYAEEEGFGLETPGTADSIPTTACTVAPCAQRVSSRMSEHRVKDGGMATRALYELVLDNAGANYPCRDALDKLAVSDTRGGVRTGTFAEDGTPPGGFPTLTTACVR